MTARIARMAACMDAQGRSHRVDARSSAVFRAAAHGCPPRMDVRMDARMDARMNARVVARMALAPRKDARMNAHGRSHRVWMLTMSCASLRGVRHVPLGPSLVVVYINLYGAAIYIASGWIGTFHPSKKLVCESGRQPNQVMV